MNKSPAKTVLQVVDLISYAKSILSNEDRPLFDDAVAAGKVGAMRAAYVMVWLACAESLKRRFREARKRDNNAGKIIGEIESKEREHKTVDKFVLAKAKEYGFVSDSGHSILSHIYEMRCLYAHPYDEAPLSEQVSHAAAMVVEHVLSKPVKLRHSFGTQLLKSLLEKHSFLDDQQTAVAAFVKEILPRLDERIRGWLLDKYWCELEKISDDSSMSVFSCRGIWFSYTMLLEVGVNVFSDAEWHSNINKFPKVLTRVCGSASIFQKIVVRAQDSLVGLIVSESHTRASVLTRLEQLNNAGVLTTRQNERFVDHVSTMTISAIRSAGLNTQTCYRKLIDAMKSYNWYTQNPAIDLIVSNGSDQVATLHAEQQVELGRNILQCAEGAATSACMFLCELSKNKSSWPCDMMRGLAMESFINENNQVRFKNRYLEQVISALECMESQQRIQLILDIAASIEEGNPTGWTSHDRFESVTRVLNVHTWTVPLVESLEKQVASLVEGENI